MGRRSVWSNEKLIALAEQFVPAADEVFRLQNGSDPDCLFFRRAVRGDEAPSRGTMQGIYVFAAGGALLGRRNSNKPDVIAAMIEDALTKWDELDETQRRLPADADIESGHRWESSYPVGGLALMRTARDLADERAPDAEPRTPFNRDQVWFSAGEARQWLPATVTAGAKHTVPDALGDRLARFHLVDNVRGQTIPYAASEVETTLRTEVTAIEAGIAVLRLSGETEANALGPWLGGDNAWKPDREWPHSVRTAIYGELRYDLEHRLFTAFDAVALGDRSGRTINNGRAREQDGGPHGIGFAFGLAPAELRIAPTFLDVYNADWVERPQ